MATPSLYALSTAHPTLLFSGQMASGANTVYTVAANKAIKISKMIITNVTGSAVTINSVHVLPSGGTVDTTHEIIHSYSLAANDTLTVTEVEGMYLGDSDGIRCNVGTASAITVTLSGVLFA